MPRDGILVCDIDGTLTSPGALHVPAEVLDALAPFNQDRRLKIATGRHSKSVERLFCGIGFVPTISLGGSALHLEGWGCPTSIVPLSEGVVDLVLSQCCGRTRRIAIFTSDSAFSPSPELFDPSTCELLGLPLNNLRQSDLTQNILKILIIGDNADLQALRERINAVQDVLLEITSSVQGYLDICAPRVDQAYFLPRCLKNLRDDRYREPYIVFIGDSFNDVCCASLANECWTFL